MIYKFRLISGDYDGCMAPPKGSRKIDMHQRLLDELKSKNKEYKVTYVAINSKRQTVRDDKANARSNENGSCYPIMQKISDYLDAKFIKLLMPDIYNELEIGKTFDQAIELLDEQQQNYEAAKEKGVKLFHGLYDESKLLTLLAQAKLADSELLKEVKLISDAPHDDYEIDFYFYDDMKEILSPLHQYLKSNPHLLPRRINLFFEPYPLPFADGTVIEYEMIKGTGETDHNWRQTIITMANDCIVSDAYQATDPVNPETGLPITNFQEARDIQFDLSNNLNCIEHYQPGASLAKKLDSFSVEKEKSKREAKKGLKKFFSSAFFQFGKKETETNQTTSTTSTVNQPTREKARQRGLFGSGSQSKKEEQTAPGEPRYEA